MESKEQRESAPDTTELARKVMRLEKLAEKVLAEDELIGIYFSKLIDVLLRYWPKSAEYRRTIENEISIYRGEVENIDKQFQEHFQYHTDKKSKLYKYNS